MEVEHEYEGAEEEQENNEDVVQQAPKSFKTEPPKLRKILDFRKKYYQI